MSRTNVKKGPGSASRPSAARVPSGARTRGRPTIEEAVRLKERIAQCALEAFMTFGFDGASIEGIARNAKVSKRTVYRNFGDKDTLFIQSALQGMRKLNFQLEKSINRRDNIDTALRRVVGQIYRIHADPQVSGLIRMAIFEGGKDLRRAELEYRNADITLAPLIDYLGWVTTLDDWHIADPRKAAIQVSSLATEGTRIFFQTAYKSNAEIARHAREVVALLTSHWHTPPANRNPPANGG